MNPKLASGADTADMLEDVLEDIGFSGLWRSSTFLAYNEQDRQCAILTDRVIEVSRIRNQKQGWTVLTQTLQLIIA